VIAMRHMLRTHAVPVPDAPAQVPMLDASDLPAEEDWAVLESLQFDHGIAAEVDPEADRFEEVKVTRGAFD
jgi:hypothetical protein